MRRALLLAVLFPCLALAAPKKKPKAEPPPPPPPPTAPSTPLAEAMGGKVVNLLTGVTAMGSYRVTIPQGTRPAPHLAIGSDFERGVKGKDVGEAELKAFTALAYEEKSFRLNATPGSCNFSPELALESTVGLDSLQILFSFKCNTLLFFTGKPGGRVLPGTSLDFKPSRKAWVAWFKGLFPADAAVQALK